METPAKYQVDRPTFTREQVLHSAYFQAIASTANSMMMAGGPPPDSEEFDDLINNAIAFTDKLIEKVGERS